MEACNHVFAAQITAFLAGLFRFRQIKRALIVALRSLMKTWTKELSVVGLNKMIREYSTLYLLSSKDLSHVNWC
jgi:phosphopantetheine adenylyltransferase